MSYPFPVEFTSHDNTSSACHFPACSLSFILLRWPKLKLQQLLQGNMRRWAFLNREMSWIWQDPARVEQFAEEYIIVPSSFLKEHISCYSYYTVSHQANHGNDYEYFMVFYLYLFYLCIYCYFYLRPVRHCSQAISRLMDSPHSLPLCLRPDIPSPKQGASRMTMRRTSGG